jgi:hypothetical protein
MSTVNSKVFVYEFSFISTRYLVEILMKLNVIDARNQNSQNSQAYVCTVSLDCLVTKTHGTTRITVLLN